jgi:dCTP deaminase
VCTRRLGNGVDHDDQHCNPFFDYAPDWRTLMPFLAQRELLAQMDKRQLIAENYETKCVRQCSYDLRLGKELYMTGESAPRILTEEEPYVSLPPGQFAILTCHEIVDIPRNMMAFLSVRFMYKLEGLVNISGFHVDPTFKGVLRFAVQNVGPADILLKLFEPTFTIFFAELTSDEIGGGRDKEEDIHFKQGLTGIRLEDVQLLGGRNFTLSTLQKEVDRLRTLVNIYGAAAVSALVALILRLIFH